MEKPTPEDLDCMLDALLDTRKQVLERKEPFDTTSEETLELLTAVSTAEINLLTWVMGLSNKENNFMNLGVCEDCGNRGEYIDLDGDEFVDCCEIEANPNAN